MTANLRPPLQAVGERLVFMSRAIIAIFLGGWILWFAPFDDLLDKQGTPLGADFSMFYVAGQVAGEGRFDRLYDQAYQQQQLHRLFPQLDNSFCLPFRYPPWVAAAASLLANLPYPAAFAIFFGASAVVWLATIRLLLKHMELPNGVARHSIACALVGWPVVWETLIGGQASFFAAGIAVASVLLLRADRQVLAGVVIAVAAYKPNVLALFAIGLIVRYPRMLLGIAPVAVLLLFAGQLLGINTALGEYLVVLGRLSDGPWDVESPFWKIHGLSSWISLAIPSQGRLITILFGLVCSVAVGIAWRYCEKEGIQTRTGSGTSTRKSCLAMAVASLLVINALLNPYTPIYDLVLLGPAAVFAVVGLREVLDGTGLSLPARSIQLQLLLATLFFGPHLSQALAKSTGLQFFPLALVAIVAVAGSWVLSRSVHRRRACPGGVTTGALPGQPL